MPEPKLGEKDGKKIHYSVGAIIVRDGKYLLVDRLKIPYGFACVAGHVDEGETPEDAIQREIKEESGLKTEKIELLDEEFIDWNECRRGVRGHYFYVFKTEAGGMVAFNSQETKSIGWYSIDEIKKLTLEPVWAYLFKKIGLL